MSRHQHHGVHRWLYAALAISWAFIACLSHAADAPMSADDILKKSQEAMKPPIQYRIHSPQSDMLVSQKIMPDGTIACRTESKLPLEKISLMLGEDSFDAYPTLGIAIDTKFLFHGAKSQAATIAATLQPGTTNSAKIKGMVTRDGRECYEIETTVAAEAIAAFSQLLPENARKMLPTGNRFVIDKETFLMVETETISYAGQPTMTMEFKDIVLNPNLSDEMFLLPVGMEVQKPKSIREYSAIVSKIIQAEVDAKYPVTPPSPPFVPEPLKIPTDRSPPLGPIKFDANGRAIPPVPPGMTQLEFDVLTTPPKPPLKMPSNHSWFRWLLILMPLAVVLTVLAVMRRKAFRSAHLPPN